MTNTQFQNLQAQFLELDERVSFYLKRLDPIILDLIQPHIRNQGKRIRPALVYLSAGITGHKCSERCHKFAAVVEMIHTASLFHDDVLDNATLRREKPTPNHLWGNDLAVLAGDLLYTTALSIIINEPLHIRKAVHNTVSVMTQAEFIQGINRFKIPDKSTYFQIIEGKTAALLSLSAMLGASITGDDLMVEELGQFGLKLGLAFQIIDDLLDWTGTVDLGKACFQDIIEGRITLPIINLLSVLHAEERKCISNLITNSVRAAEIETGNFCLEKMKNWNIFPHIREYASSLINESVQFLNKYQDSDYKNGLIKLTQMVISREK
ncbi:polyprenyl synthetase family protein [bacterium]|nr:polyprenyl synthetase family protein [bacterium]